MLVVDDLLADVDRGPVDVQRLLHRLDRTIDAGAIAARRRHHDPLHRRRLRSGAGGIGSGGSRHGSQCRRAVVG
ncbi:hypothetical protein SDC9_105589 [bioreactor metagenome]|uniref:Uncharacterized protein n=1 Tax=bioreactor metagenome TaxID=1076179 RepID=A0A645B124_9ZZZZ